MRSTVMILALAFSFASACVHGSILNGDFSTAGVAPDPFANWVTDDLFFDRPSDGGGFSVFADTGSFGSSQLAQTFVLPLGAISISFELQIGAVLGGASGLPVPDSFQATLFDSGGGTLFPSDPLNPLLFPAYYSIDNDGTTEFYDPAFVTSADIGGGFKRITLDVSSLATQTLALDFLLNGFADGLTTTVDLDNVILSPTIDPIPEPSSCLIWCVLGATMISRRLRRQFSSVVRN